MSDIQLLNSTGCSQIDDILQGVIGLFETVFSNRIRAYYIVGSYDDGSAVAASDLDAHIIFKDSYLEYEAEKANQIWRYCSLVSPISLDLNPRDENQLFRIGMPDTKLGSTLIYGTDIRDKIPLMPIDHYQHLLMHIPYRFLAQVRKHPPYLHFPLAYPEPDAEFFGYDRRIMQSADGKRAKGMKDLIMSIGVAAKALVCLKAGIYLERKSELIPRYQEHIHDEWTELLTDIYNKCNKQWGYFVPEDEGDKQELKALCRRALAFENHFLAVYRDFLLAELSDEIENLTPFSVEQATEILGLFGETLPKEVMAEYVNTDLGYDKLVIPAKPILRLLALKALGRVIYPDEEVLNSLTDLTNCGTSYLEKAALETIKRIQGISK